TLFGSATAVVVVLALVVVGGGVVVAVYVEVSSVVGTATAGLTGSLALALPCCLNTRTPAVTSARTTTTAVAEPNRMMGRRELFGFGIAIGYAAAGALQGSA
ncbi:hypothetical protein, partial [Mycolicibacterium fortuitum]|uniref:hypothetical protein n=1 Tax=Mycolicibacterium fortuitum TaxID=1766 RepID=UPI001A97596F